MESVVAGARLDFQPFQTQFSSRRVVAIPAQADGAQRDVFVRKVRDAVHAQAALAEKADSILKVDPNRMVVEHDRIVIEHEPAAAIDPARALASEDRPPVETLWWLAWGTLRGLRALGEANVQHGAIQLGSIYIDETGCLKLGDLGLSQVFESALGSDVRQRVHLDTSDAGAVSGGCSGVWALVDEYRDYGCMPPFVAPELLGGLAGGRFTANPRADQFSLGVVLAVLGTGGHPYNISLSESAVDEYWVYRPAVGARRGDWRDPLDRVARKVGTPADKRIADWCALVERLAQFQIEERFPKAEEAERIAAGMAPTSWEEAVTSLAGARASVLGGQVDAAARSAERWKQESTIPELWRARLSLWIADLQQRRKEIEEQIRLRQRRDALLQQLVQAEEAIQNVNIADEELQRIEAVAREVASSPEAEEATRTRAAALQTSIGQLREQVDDFTREMYQLARRDFAESLALGRFDRARETVLGVQGDPKMMTLAKAWPDEALAEVAAEEQRYRAIEEETRQAEEALATGVLEPARATAEALLSRTDLPESLRDSVVARAQAVRDAATQAMAERERYQTAIAESREAWERGDADVAEAALAPVPSDCSYVGVADERIDLAERIAGLRAASALEVEGDAALTQAVAAEAEGRTAEATDDFERALSSFNAALSKKTLPPCVVDRIKTKAGQCSARLRDIITAAETALERAQTAYDAMDFAAARQALEGDVARGERLLPVDESELATALRKLLDQVDAAVAAMGYVRGHLRDAEPRPALDKLERIKIEGLPRGLVAQLDALRAEAEQTLRKQEEAEKQRVAEILARVEATLAEGALGDARTALQTIETDTVVSRHSDLTERVRRAAALLARDEPTLAAIAALERAISTNGAIDAVRSGRHALPGDLPPWAVPRVATIDDWIRQREEQVRKAERDKLRQRLAAAGVALAAGKLSEANDVLRDVKKGCAQDDELREQWETLAGRVAELQGWSAQVAELEALHEAGKLAELYKRAHPMLKSPDIPEAMRGRIQTLHDAAKKTIAARQKEIDAGLVALDGEVAAAPADALTRQAIVAWRARAQALRDDTMCSPDQRSRGDALLKRIDEAASRLPRSKGRLVAAISVVGLVGAACAAFFLLRGPAPTPTPIPTPTPSPTPNPQVIAQKEQALADQWSRALSEFGALATGLNVRFEIEPDNAFGSNVYAYVDNQRIGRPLSAVPIENEDALNQLNLDDIIKLALGEIAPERRLPDLLARYAASAVRKAAQAEQDPAREKPEWSVSFRPGDAAEPTAGEIVATAGDRTVPSLTIARREDLRTDRVDEWIRVNRDSFFPVRTERKDIPVSPTTIAAGRIQIDLPKPYEAYASKISLKLQPDQTIAVPADRRLELAAMWLTPQGAPPAPDFRLRGTLAAIDAAQPASKVTFTPDTDASDGGFPAALHRLQQARAEMLKDATHWDSLPQELRSAVIVDVPTASGGDALDVRFGLKPAAGQAQPIAVASHAAVWKPASLDYAAPEWASIRAALIAAYVNAGRASSLQSEWGAFWRSIVGNLKGTDGKTLDGTDYVARCEIDALATDGALAQNSSIGVTLTLGPPRAAGVQPVAGDQIPGVTLRVALTPTAFTWAKPTPQEQAALVQAIASRVAAFRGDAGFAERRIREAAASAGYDLDDDQVKAAAGGRDVEIGDKVLSFARVDRELLVRGPRVEPKRTTVPDQPPRTLDDELAALAAKPSCSGAELVAVLGKIAAAKRSRYNANPPFSILSPLDSLASITNRVSRSPPINAAPPTRFVEFFEGSKGTFGVTWSAGAETGRVFRVESPQAPLGPVLSEPDAGCLAIGGDGALWSVRWREQAAGRKTWCLPSLVLESPIPSGTLTARGFAGESAQFKLVPRTTFYAAILDDKRTGTYTSEYIWRQPEKFIGDPAWWNDGFVALPSNQAPARVLITVLRKGN